MYKALITDLDGTAVPFKLEGMPTPAVIEAIVKAQAEIFVSVATGRPFTLCTHILQALHIVHPCIVEGGSCIINPRTEEILWEQTLSASTMEKIKLACQPYEFSPSTGSSALIPITKPTFRGSNRMMVLLRVEEEEANRIIDQLRQLPEVMVLKVISWADQKWDVHICHIGASKRHALEVLLGMHNFKSTEVIGVGDGHNDLALFEASGLKIAMGNACEELKAVADYIAPSVDEDGLAQVIEKFVLKSS